MELDYSSCVLITQVPPNYKLLPVQLKQAETKCQHEGGAMWVTSLFSIHLQKFI